jgi:hypothetical protein
MQPPPGTPPRWPGLFRATPSTGFVLHAAAPELPHLPPGGWPPAARAPAGPAGPGCCRPTRTARRRWCLPRCGAGLRGRCAILVDRPPPARCVLLCTKGTSARPADAPQALTGGAGGEDHAIPDVQRLLRRDDGAVDQVGAEGPDALLRDLAPEHVPDGHALGLARQQEVGPAPRLLEPLDELLGVAIADEVAREVVGALLFLPGRTAGCGYAGRHRRRAATIIALPPSDGSRAGAKATGAAQGRRCAAARALPCRTWQGLTARDRSGAEMEHAGWQYMVRSGATGCLMRWSASGAGGASKPCHTLWCASGCSRPQGRTSSRGAKGHDRARRQIKGMHSGRAPPQKN